MEIAFGASPSCTPYSPSPSYHLGLLRIPHAPFPIFLYSFELLALFWSFH